MGTDPVMYFVQAANIVHGRPLYVTQQPPGYPFALAALHFIGCDTVRGVVTLNFVALAIACVGSWRLLRTVFNLSVTEAAIVLILTLGSVTCVGFTTAAMSEVCFFATSVVALVCLERFRANGSWWAFAAGLASVALSIEFRTAGWALVAAVLAAVYLRFNLRISKRMPLSHC